MLDTYVRPLIDPPLDRLGKRLWLWGVTPNQMTMFSFGAGLLAMVCIILNDYALGMGFICLNRLGDGLDGAIARHRGLSDFGGFLDIVCDFIIYAGVVFAVGMNQPHHLFHACFLLLSFIGPMVSFLGYGIMAAKRDVHTTKRGKKSFYYLGGLCEGTETAFVLILVCMIPQFFDKIAMVFGVMCWMTTLGRIHSAWQDFGQDKPQ